MSQPGIRTHLRIVSVVLVLAGAGGAFAQNAGAAKKLAGAEGLMARGQYDLARREFDEFLQTYPAEGETTRAQYGKALSAYQMNDLATAGKELEAVVADKKFARRDEALAVLTALYLATGETSKSLVASSTLLKEYPASGQVETVIVNKAQALYRHARYSESLAEVSAMLKVYPTSPHRAAALYVGALDRHAMGQEAPAGALLQEIVTKYPNAPFFYDAQVLLGDTLAGQGKNDEAIAHLTRVRADAPASRRAAVDLAIAGVHVRASRYDEAQAALDGVIASEKNSPLAAQAKLQKAVVQVKAGQRREARQALAGVARDYPALAASAGYWLARCDLLDGDVAQARAALTRLLDSKPAPPEAPEIIFDLAYTELMSGDNEKALARLESFRAGYPYSGHDTEALYYQATALHRLGEFAKSSILCDEIAKRPSTTLARPAAILKGENLLMQKSYAEADTLFASLETSASTDAENLRLSFRRAQCAYFSADYKTAEARLSPYAAATTKEPLHSEAMFLLADAQLQQAKHARAMASFKAYLADGKDVPHAQEAAYKLALAQLGAGDTKAAEATLADLATGDARTAWVQRGNLRRAELAFDRRDWDAAERIVLALLATGPEEAIAATAAYLRARIEMETSRYSDAVAHLADFARTYPKNALAEEASFTRGVALKQSGKPAEAVEQFAAYLNTYPTGKLANQARHQRAAALSAAGKPSEAAAALAQLASERATRSDAVLYDLAWAQRNAGDTRAATDTYQALIKEFPSGPRTAPAKVELAELSSDKPADAAALLMAAIKDPATDAKSRGVAMYRLGQTYLRLSQPGKAADAFDTFVAENAKDALLPAALCEAGSAHLQAGHLDGARQRLKRVIADFPGTDAAKLATIRMGDVQNQAGEYAAAAATFGRFLTDHGSEALAPQAQLGLGWSLENQGKTAEARVQYAKVVATDNSAIGARAQFQMGETYFAEKHFELAAKELLKVDIQYHVPEWSARALYEAGRAFEELKDPARARAQFEECLKKYPASDVAPLAKKRLESL